MADTTLKWYHLVKIQGYDGTCPAEVDPGLFEVFQGIGSGAKGEIDSGWLSFDLPDGWDYIVEAIDFAWDTFWDWIIANDTPDEGTRSARGLPAVVVAALPAVRAKLTLIKAVAAVLLPILPKIPGAVSKIVTLWLTVYKYTWMYQVVDKLLDLWQGDESSGTNDLTPILTKLEEMRVTMEDALMYDDGSKSILQKAFLFDGADHGVNNASILKEGLLFQDPEDLYIKGVLERGLLKQVFEMDGDQQVRVVKSLLELLQIPIQDLSYVDAKMILGNFAMHVMGKCVEHA